MNKNKTYLMVFVLGVHSIVSGAALTGRVIDNLPGPYPVANAAVSLLAKGVKTTTDTLGLFSIVVSATINDSKEYPHSAMRIVGSRLFFTSQENEILRIDLFSLRGQKLGCLLDRSFGAGEYSLEIPLAAINLEEGDGPFVVKARKGKDQFVGLFVPMPGTGRKNVHKREADDVKRLFPLEKKSASYDTLLIAKPGFIPKKIALSSNVGGDLGDIVLSYFVHAWAHWPMPNPQTGGLCNPSIYADQGDSTVLDKVTGLTWQKYTPSTKYAWVDAHRYCSNLALAGGGWRMPSRVEVMSLVDFTRTGPAIDRTAFPSTPANFFFTSSPWILSVTDTTRPKLAWVFNFYEGLTSNAGSQANPSCVRCVRGGDDEMPGTSPDQYTLEAPGEVRDNFTGLIWQQEDSPIKMTWADAKIYSDTLSLNSHTWRLPSIKELATLVDETKVAGAINRTMFPGTSSNEYYWSSSPWAGDASKSSSGAWAINFDDGYTSYNGFTTGWVRCVRCGQ